jgi:glycosyltransferase 2 family protein
VRADAPLVVEAAAARPGSRTRRAGMIVVGLLISALFIWLAIRKISLSDVWTGLREANYAWVIPSLAFTLLTTWLKAVRWRLLFDRPASIPTGVAFWGICIGLGLNNVLPSRAGEVGRVFAVRRVTGHSAFEIGMTILVERVLDLLVVAIFALVIWPWLPHRGWINALALVCAAVVAGFLVAILLLTVFRKHIARLVPKILARVPRVSPDRALSVQEGLRAGARILVHPGRLGLAVFVTALGWGAAGISGLVLLPAFDFDAGTLAPWLVLVASTFAVTIPSSAGAAGVYEASVQASLTAFGISSSGALSYALVLHAVNFFPVIVLALVGSTILRRMTIHTRLVKPDVVT